MVKIAMMILLKIKIYVVVVAMYTQYPTIVSGHGALLLLFDRYRRCHHYSTVIIWQKWSGRSGVGGNTAVHAVVVFILVVVDRGCWGG